MNELLRRSRGPHVSQRLPDRCGLGAAGASYAPDRWSPIPPTGLEREAKPSPSVTIRRSQRLPVIPRRISLVPQLPIVASRFTRDERLLWSFLCLSHPDQESQHPSSPGIWRNSKLAAGNSSICCASPSVLLEFDLHSLETSCFLDLLRSCARVPC
jgi:hypothetical protein